MMSNLNSGTKRNSGGWLRLGPAEAFRRGWESARRGEALDAAYYDSLRDPFEAANYEIGRLLVLEGRRLGLDDVPIYRRLSSRERLVAYADGTRGHAVQWTPSVRDYLGRVGSRAKLEGMKLLPRRDTHQPADETLSFAVTLPGRPRRTR